MSCQTVITVAINKAKQEGCIPVYNTVYVSHADFDETMKDLQSFADSGQGITLIKNDELKEKLFNEYGHFKQDVLDEMAQMNHGALISMIKELGDPMDSRGGLLTHAICLLTRFSVDEIMALNNSMDRIGISLVEYMVMTKQYFSVDDIIKLGNPLVSNNSNLAHFSVTFGQRFSGEDIYQLGDPPDSNGNKLSFRVATQTRDSDFTFEDIVKLGNPVDTDGYTLAHILARNSELKFTDEQIELLGNPLTNDGKTILHYQNWLLPK